MKLPSLLILIATATLFASPASAETRTWTQSNNGKTVDAEFVSFADGKITLKFASGKTRAIDANLFSQQDQDYANEQQAEIAAMELASDPATKANAYEEATLWNVHMCCNACVTRLKKAAISVKGTTTQVDKEGGFVVVRAKQQAELQKVYNAVAAAGFYGESTSNFDSLKIPDPKESTKTVSSATFSGVHLCCDDCVDALRTALGEVKGVTDFKVIKDTTTFSVAGEFKTSDVVAAIHKAGFHATVK